MITTEQILELAKEHLEDFSFNFSFDNGAECAWADFAATREQLIDFAQKIYEEGYENGWGSRADAEYFNFDYLKLQENHND